MFLVATAVSVWGQERAPVRHAFGWLTVGIHAPWVTAKAKGFYAEEGLDVTFAEPTGAGGLEGLKLLLAGQVGFADVPAGNLILAVSQGEKIRSVFGIYEKSPSILYVLKDGPVRTLKDLEGRRVITNVGDANRVLFPPLARANGIDESKIQWVETHPAQKLNAFLAGKGEALAYFMLSDHVVRKQMRRRGELRGFFYADYGVDIYGNQVIAKDELIAKSPDLVRRFVRATTRGYAYAFERPDEATEILIRHKPVLQAENTKAEILALRSIVLTEVTQKHGLGYTYPEKWERTKAAMAEAYKIQRVPGITLLYTTRFLVPPAGSRKP